MRHRFPNAVLALGWAIVSSLPAAAAPQRAENILTHEEAVAAGGAIAIENLLGSVTVRGGGEPGRVRVEARVVAEAETAEEADLLARSVTLDRRLADGRVLVHVAYPVERHAAYRIPDEEAGRIARWLTPLLRKKTVGAFYGDRPVQLGPAKGAVGLAAHLTLTVPNDLRTAVRQFLGSVECDLVKGHLEIENVEGTVHVGQIYGTLVARAGGGDLELLTAKGERIELQTAAGSVQIVDIQTGELRVQTGSGAVSGRAISASAIAVEAESGAVELFEVDGRELTVATASGDIDLTPKLQRTREAQVRSASGNVTLRLGTLAPFDLAARSASGAVKAEGSSFKVSQKDKTMAEVRRGSGGADLRVETASGDVLVRTR